ncbi:MAG: hypothetical protein FWG64_04835 [Firmicutes bacterium]|nr:hypothetical protein [Bacillota bacterium]
MPSFPRAGTHRKSTARAFVGQNKFVTILQVGKFAHFMFLQIPSPHNLPRAGTHRKNTARAFMGQNCIYYTLALKK